MPKLINMAVFCEWQNWLVVAFALILLSSILTLLHIGSAKGD